MRTAIAILIGAVLIPLIAWRVVGARRKRDPLLLPTLIIALGFAAGGVGELVSNGAFYNWKLTLGLLGLAAVTTRWRRAGTVDTPKL